MTDNQKSIAIYSRKSKFTGKGESIENQTELCKEYIKIHYGNEALKRIIIYEDEGFSGGNLNRPDFKRMMEDAYDNKLSFIIVYRLDRISRNIGDFSKLIDELSVLNINFISIKEQFDTNTPMGRAMMYISSVFSQLERETIAERIKDNMFELSKSGVWLGGVTPTGYKSKEIRKDNQNAKSKRFYMLEQVPKEIEIIKLIFKLYLEYESLTKTQSELINIGVKTKNQKHFTRFSIKAILENPVYAIADSETYEFFKSKDSIISNSKYEFNSLYGIMPYNRTKQQKGKAAVPLPYNEWVIAIGMHKGIILGKDWVKVQNLLSKNKSGNYNRTRINKALLTGLIYCECGSRMYPKLTKYEDENGNRKFTYICKLKEQSKKSLCKSKNTDGNKLDKLVLDRLEEVKEDYCLFMNCIDNVFECDNEVLNSYEMYLSQKKLNEQKIDNLLDTLTITEDNILKEKVLKRIDIINMQNAHIDLLVSELREKEDNIFSKEDLDYEAYKLSDFKKAFNMAGINDKRRCISLLIKKVVLIGNTAQIYL